jgi:hypothetical protein
MPIEEKNGPPHGDNPWGRQHCLTARRAADCAARRNLLGVVFKYLATDTSNMLNSHDAHYENKSQENGVFHQGSASARLGTHRGLSCSNKQLPIDREYSFHVLPSFLRCLRQAAAAIPRRRLSAA